LVSVRIRCITVFYTLITCFVLRIPSLFALTVHRYDSCPDFVRSLAVEPQEWAMESEIYYFYDFYFIVFLQIFLPFGLLVGLNILIVIKLAKDTTVRKLSEAVSFNKRDDSIQKSNISSSIRNAVCTMLAIVFSYLICNSLHLGLTILERTQSSILITEEDETLASPFYTIFGDTVSILYMFTSSIRISIYAKFNPRMRRHIIAVFVELCTKCG
uniref:G_PROTEIN_RECEP_F1_2 domain-containing protein n=1 Tax=Anisakis simplex TaxID=6269 RepID=A0A0M3J1X6_ANISI